MRQLVRAAGHERQQEPWARVHALNTLRLIFNDKNLANDVSGFFAEGTCALCPYLGCCNAATRPGTAFVASNNVHPCNNLVMGLLPLTSFLSGYVPSQVCARFLSDVQSQLSIITTNDHQAYVGHDNQGCDVPPCSHACHL